MDIFKVLLKLKMATTDQLFFLGGRKNLSQKLFKLYNHIPHDMEMCIDFLLKVLLKFKMSAMDELHNFCGFEKLKKWSQQ